MTARGYSVTLKTMHTPGTAWEVDSTTSLRQGTMYLGSDPYKDWSAAVNADREKDSHKNVGFKPLCSPVGPDRKDKAEIAETGPRYTELRSRQRVWQWAQQ